MTPQDPDGWTDASAGSIRATLRRLGVSGDPWADSAAGSELVPSAGVAARTGSLVRLAALIATGSAPHAVRRSGEEAIAAGVSVDEIVGTLVAVAPIVGMARLVAAAPAVALAVGYDIEAAFEDLDAPSDRRAWPP